MKSFVAIIAFALLIGAAVANVAVPTREFSDKVARIGYKAPDFEAPAVIGKDFHLLKLSQYTGKWVVLLFYPLDYTFVCPTELIAFSERVSEFENINTQVVGISVDSKFTHLAWANTPRNHGGLGGVKFPLVSDLTRHVSQLYGAMYLESGHSLRALFVIDPNQKLRSMTMHDDQVGRNVDEVLRVVKAFQYADEHGEVCPANWKPGQPTMKPNPVESLQYFETVFQEKLEK